VESPSLDHWKQQNTWEAPTIYLSANRSRLNSTTGPLKDQVFSHTHSIVPVWPVLSLF
jgi:hypothetical protein